MGDYRDLTHEEFVRILTELLDGKTGEEILAYPGAWEVFSEELNNDVLEEWDRRQAEPELDQAVSQHVDELDEQGDRAWADSPPSWEG